MQDVSLDLDDRVTAAAAGDVDAFAELVGAASGLVSSIALAILRDLDASRDVAQDVFLIAWRDLKTLRHPSSFLPWLRQITRNRAHHVLRTRVRARRRGAGTDAEEALQVIADPHPGADTVLVAAEDIERLREALNSLPDDARETVLLYYREGQSVRQVATLLDVSEDAVKKRLSRARQSLRATLLDKVGATIAGTAPGSVFTVAVVSAISLSGPPAAAATVTALTRTTAESVATGAATTFALFVLVPLAGALAGAAGFLTGMRALSREARDEEERRVVDRTAWVMAALFVALWAPLPLWWRLPRPWGFVLPVLLHTAAFFVLQFVWLPRVLARRFALEMLEDPEGATARRARERRVHYASLGIGLLGAAMGQLIAFIATS